MLPVPSAGGGRWEWAVSPRGEGGEQQRAAPSAQSLFSGHEIPPTSALAVPLLSPTPTWMVQSAAVHLETTSLISAGSP